jgi:hypothetical protein
MSLNLMIILEVASMAILMMFQYVRVKDTIDIDKKIVIIEKEGLQGLTHLLIDIIKIEDE